MLSRCPVSVPLLGGPPSLQQHQRRLPHLRMDGPACGFPPPTGFAIRGEPASGRGGYPAPAAPRRTNRDASFHGPPGRLPADTWKPVQCGRDRMQVRSAVVRRPGAPAMSGKRGHANRSRDVSRGSMLSVRSFQGPAGPPAAIPAPADPDGSDQERPAAPDPAAGFRDGPGMMSQRQGSCRGLCVVVLHHHGVRCADLA